MVKSMLKDGNLERFASKLGVEMLEEFRQSVNKSFDYFLIN